MSNFKDIYSDARERRRVVVLRLNGTSVSLALKDNDVLLDAIRENAGLTGTKRGCDMGTCGCCTVLIDGQPRLSCLTLAAEAEGLEVNTVEGLKVGPELSPLQEMFAVCGGSQCGYCTPGFLMTTTALLRAHPHPSVSEIKEAISGNMCRCTGYIKIVEAIQEASRISREGAGE